MSKAHTEVGFKTCTLDNDPKKEATSKLALDQHEGLIVNGLIQHHPNLFKRFNHIHAGPECRTWSRAGSGTHRNSVFIDGFMNK